MGKAKTVTNQTLEVVESNGKEVVNLDNLNRFYQNLEEVFVKKDEIVLTGVDLVISSSAPIGNTKTLWINSNELAMYYFDGSQWISLGAAWK